MTEEIIINEKSLQAVLKQCDKLEQENKELKELKCKFKEYCTCDTEKYRSALEEIRNYCDRIEQGSVIGTQDCLINSIKNIANEALQ